MSAVKIGGSGVDDLVEVPICVAMRGRNPCNPSSRKTGIETVQMIEPADDGKANSFLATSGKGAWANGMSLVSSNFRIRRITPTECARLQTIPDWYKWECSATQQYRMLGNGWTVEVIKHILSFIKIEEKL